MKVWVLSKKKLAQTALTFALIGCSLGLLNVSPYQLAGTVSAVVNKVNPIYFVQTEEPKISISFDATWGAEHTATILENLKKHNVQATFFLTNIWLKEYPEMAKTIAQDGHEIAMHSVTHPHMNTLSSEQIRQEVADNATMIKDVTGYEPILFRLPFGEYNNGSISTIKEMGYYPIQWSIDSLDWKEEMSKTDIVQRVTKDLHKGAIILCHNNGTYTAEAIDEILTFAEESGYQVVPIGQLIYKGDYKVDHQGAQSPK